MFFSMDMTTFPNEVWFNWELKKWKFPKKKGEKKFQTPMENLMMMVFIVCFFYLGTNKHILFKSSFAFLAVVFGVIFVSYTASNDGVFNSDFMLITILNVAILIVSSYLDEQSAQKRFKARHSMQVCEARIDTILNTLMPPLVIEQLRELPANAALPSHHYLRATVSQSDLCGFTRIAATRTPQEVVTFMSDLFGRFDKLTEKYDVYKIETVGDAYISMVAEHTVTRTNSVVAMVRFGLSMIDAVHEWARGMGEQCTCRVGVHHGECIGGIVGTDMQRYHIFGELMSGVEVLESTAPEGYCQVSKACKEAIDRELSKAKASGHQAIGDVPSRLREDEHLKTSKGEVHEYSEVGGTTYIIDINARR
jgi:class 3 adenylate cyclase